jgi:integrase
MDEGMLKLHSARISPSGRNPRVFVNPDAQRRKGNLAARIEGAAMYMTRHTFASWAIQRVMPLAEVQQYLGTPPTR